jgi:hypothetical protein
MAYDGQRLESKLLEGEAKFMKTDLFNYIHHKLMKFGRTSTKRT